MAQKSPNSKEVVDLQFKLHARRNIFNCNDSLTNNTNLLAVSSVHGLLFAGDPEKPELKIFMLKNLIGNETASSDVLVRVLPLASSPKLLACSCDGSMLAVNYVQGGSSFLQIFSTTSLLTPSVSSFYKIPLSPENNADCWQILWNPVIPNNLAVILKNGALSMYTLKDGGQYEMYNVDKSQQIQCGCWSPKGKQIVLGFANGKLQQFKPDLTPAKTINCPPGIHNGPFSTVAVHWLSTFQFAVAFVQDGEDNIPSLYIVNAPKGGNPSYINYFDVCYTMGQRIHQMHFTHIQQWNLLLVTSANGIEVGLLGCDDGAGDTPTWIQYRLLDEARIEMPLTDSNDETFPIGFAFDTSSTHQLIFDDKQLPVMPMIHVLSTNGQLLSFNFLNLRQGTPDICSPPPPISYSQQHFQSLTEILKQQQQNKIATSEPAIPSNLIASTPLSKDKNPPIFGAIPSIASTPQLPALGSIAKSTANATAKVGSVQPMVSSAFGNMAVTNTVANNMSFAALGAQQNQTTQAKPQFQPQLQQPQQQQQQQKSSQHSTSVVGSVKSTELNKPLYMVPPNFTPPPTSTATIAADGKQTQKTQSNKVISNDMQKGFLELIAVQINAFDKEIKYSANQSKGLLENIGSPDEMRVCTKRLNDLHEIIEQANDHEFEVDVQNLRHSLNEARAIIAECRWKVDKYKNPDLPRLGNNSSDPANRRQLAKLQSYVTSNEAQIQLMKHLIDIQWSNFQDIIRRNTKSQIHTPCLDGVYQRMSKMQETLMRQRAKINQIKAKLQKNGLLHRMINNGKSLLVNGQHEVTIDSLADSILSMTLAPVVDENRAKLSNEKLNAIREFTRQRKTVNIIKAQRPNRVGLNSEVVLETMLQSERNKMRESLSASVAEEHKREIKATITKEPLLPKPTATKPLVSSAQSPFVLTSIAAAPTAAPNFSFSNAVSFAKPNPTMPTGTQDFKNIHQQPQLSLQLPFKSPAVLSGFNAPHATTTTTMKTNIEPTKTGLTTPEDELPTMPQSPISFAAKVIGGTAASSKSGISGIGIPTGLSATSATNFIKPSSTSENEQRYKHEPTNKPFSIASPTGTSNIFSGLTSTPTSAPAPFSASNTSLPMLDTKVGGGATSFSFAGFTANNALKSSGPVATTTATSISTTPKPAAVSLFSGFGKTVGADNLQAQPTAPLNLIQAPTSISKVSEASLLPSATSISLAPASSVTSAFSTVSPILSSITVSSTSSQPTESLLEDLTICKPTTKPAEPAKSATSLFSGFGGSTSSSFSFTPVTGNSSFSFADLTKSLATSTATQPITTTTTVTSTVKDIVSEKTISSTIPSSATEAPKSTEFTFSSDSLGTSSTAASITSADSTSKSTTTASIFGSLGLVPTAVGATVSTTASSVSSPVPASASAPAPAFGTASAGIFSSVASTATTGQTTSPVSSGGSLFAAVTPAVTSTPSLTSTFGGFNVGTTAAATVANTQTGGSIFSAPAPVNTAPSGNIFGGGIPKPDQSIFSTATSSQAPTTGIFAAAAQNASPFGGATTSPPPNQTVTSGGIFGGAGGFAAPSIFGGGAATAAASPASSPFGTSAAAPAPAVSGGSLFANTTAKPADAVTGGIFGSAAQQASTPAASGGSIFGQSSFGTPANTQTPTGGLFSNALQQQQPAFGATSTSLFGAAANTSGTSGGPLFGSSAAVAPSSFGSPAAATGSTGFGSFSQPNPASPFSSPNSTTAGAFGQGAGGASVAQTGFGSPQQGSAFNRPVFGGPATFGSPPTFGSQPTFGGSPTFGSFTTPAATSPGTGAFGASAQQSNLFETLGSSDSGLSFGNLAQSASSAAPKPPFGGSSFTSYRS